VFSAIFWDFVPPWISWKNRGDERIGSGAGFKKSAFGPWDQAEAVYFRHT
jgi:hypothetical protein